MLRTLCLLAVILLFAPGCADEALVPAPESGVARVTIAADDAAPDPFSALRSRVSGPTLAKRSPSGPSGTFGLIQGLAAAPNGELLVADLIFGLATYDGSIEVALPGATDMSPIGRRSLWATTGPVGDNLPEGESVCILGETTFENCGQALYRVSGGSSRLIADLFAFEDEHNPDGVFGLARDSNPYDVKSLGGNAALVVDAAGNDLLRVNNRGHVDVLAVFPPGEPDPTFGIPPEAVPTSVAIGPDGHYYVGELTGFPATPGVSGIWRVAPDAENAVCPSADCVKVFDGGFTSIIDLAFDADGTLYVAELDESSWLAFVPGGPAPTGGTINACDISTQTCSAAIPVGPFLNAIAFGRDGKLWATTAFGSMIASVDL